MSADAEHIAAAFAAFCANYLERHTAMMAAWADPPRPRMMWLLYSSSYLFNTHGIRWALDPLQPDHLLRGRLPAAPVAPLQKLSFVLLSHRHSDHFDIPLLQLLRDGNTRFVVPEHMADEFRARVNPRPERILTARHGQALEIDGIGIEPFASRHGTTHPDGRIAGPASTGYRILIDGLAYLFPNDVRSYHADSLQPFAPADHLFAHLWLGQACATMAAPPLRAAFCEFLRGASPRAVTLTHLYQFKRANADLWHKRHCDMISRCWRERYGADITLRSQVFGEGVVL